MVLPSSAQQIASASWVVSLQQAHPSRSVLRSTPHHAAGCCEAAAADLLRLFGCIKGLGPTARLLPAKCQSGSCVLQNGVSTSSNNSSGGGSNTGAIVGGVVGGIAGLAIIGLIAALFMLRRTRKRQVKHLQPQNPKDIDRATFQKPLGGLGCQLSGIWPQHEKQWDSGIDAQVVVVSAEGFLAWALLEASPRMYADCGSAFRLCRA